MDYTAFLQSQSDAQLQQILQSGSVPPEFVQQEIMQRARLRLAAEGADKAPEFSMGLGSARYGGQ